jgi:hypothetical protein
MAAARVTAGASDSDSARSNALDSAGTLLAFTIGRAPRLGQYGELRAAY